MGIFGKAEKTPAQTVVEDVLKVKKNETALIIANPETTAMAQDIFTALLDAGAKPSLIFQTKKATGEAADKTVIGAIKSEPNIAISVSALKLGRDVDATSSPYTTPDGKKFDNIFDYLLDGKKTMRAVWTPGLTQDIFDRTVNIDYKQLSDRCKKICAKYEDAVSVHVTSPNGTDVIVPVQGRSALSDNGDFSSPGSGGNIPAGEVFISPVVGVEPEDGKKSSAAKTAQDDATQSADDGEKKEDGDVAQALNGTQGTIVFDGSMTFAQGDALLENYITVKVEQGFVTEVTGGKEAQRLLHDIQTAEKEALAMEAAGKLPEGSGAVYSRNARNIGELGIGLNPAANITGNMLEDEKAFRTCHFAIGENYDGDAPALIHFDGVVRNPTIVINYADGSSFTLLDRGDLKI